MASRPFGYTINILDCMFYIFQSHGCQDGAVKPDWILLISESVEISRDGKVTNRKAEMLLNPPFDYIVKHSVTSQCSEECTLLQRSITGKASLVVIIHLTWGIVQPKQE